MRLDQWLWAVRVYATRSLAVEAIKGRRVKVNGEAVKPARTVRAGDLVTARVGVILRTLRVVDSPRSRVGAKLVAQFADDLTPPEELAKRDEGGVRAPAFRPPGAGRPTKRERRVMEDFSAGPGASDSSSPVGEEER
jgi:ribosome-associated heat shock protein Hsp15